ncbi:hypothetical protein [Methanolobus sp.]|uniref:hypothetical protein n=1 Tax=Methanolobus sp. TaxID=1874737 RepID=UPI0025CC3417|nr:hypothetical protein [Methanolobus sp.]
MSKLQYSKNQYTLTIPKDIVELEGWSKGQEIKFRRISAKGEEYIALIPVE